MLVAHEGSRARVQAVQAPRVGADPESTLAILENVVDVVVGEARGIVAVVEVTDEAVLVTIVTVQPTSRAHPQDAVPRGGYRCDVIVGEALGVIRVREEVIEAGPIGP